MGTSFVSGFTGFIALHIVKNLLAKGETVIGSVRSSKKGDEYAKVINNPNFSYVVVPDIGTPGAFDKVFQDHKEINHVYHVASPLLFSSEDPENEIVKPAKQGTVGILQSIKNYGSNVTRVITTSSYSAHNSPLDHYGKTDRIVTEDMVSSLKLEDCSIDAFNYYWYSKKEAELAAWEFMEKNKPNFKLTTLSPTWCFGPQAYSELPDNVSTLSIFQSILGLSADAEVVNRPGLAIDVRDIADGQIKALEIPETEGKRLLLSDRKFNETSILNIINDNFDLKLPNPPKIKWEEIDCPFVDCSKTLKLLDMKLRPYNDCVIDTVKFILSKRETK